MDIKVKDGKGQAKCKLCGFPVFGKQVTINLTYGTYVVTNSFHKKCILKLINGGDKK